MELEAHLDAMYIEFYMRVQNISWHKYKTKEEIYRYIPPISKIIFSAQNRLFLVNAIMLNDKMNQTSELL